MELRVVELSLTKLRIDDCCQSRARTAQDVVDDYAGYLLAGVRFPPVVVFRDKVGCYWLADGFHRYYAHKQAGRKMLLCDVRPGEVRDAILFSVSANIQHGLRRSNEDKRHCVSRLLGDDEWSRWSDREIARRCGVSDFLVRALRGELLSASKTQTPAARITSRGGTTYSIDVTNLVASESVAIAEQEAEDRVAQLREVQRLLSRAFDELKRAGLGDAAGLALDTITQAARLVASLQGREAA